MTAHYPGMAQLVARLTGGQEAAGSSPVTRTKSAETAHAETADFFNMKTGLEA